MLNRFLPIAVFFFAASISNAQEDLLSNLEQEQKTGKEYVSSTFKSTRIVNTQSVEMLRANHLDFRISHRFGRVNSGFYDWFGLDDATIRIGAEYGITDRINMGIGRSSFAKMYDGYLKLLIVRQGLDRGSPVSVAWFSNMAYTNLRTSNQYVNDHPSARFSYVHQLLVARKFGDLFSLQVSPALVHRNYVASRREENNIFATAVGGRLKISNRVTLNADYIYRFNGMKNGPFYNSVAIGCDIDTGGHVFQLHFTNSQGMVEQMFIANTMGDISKGDIYFGFNISRVFSFGK